MNRSLWLGLIAVGIVAATIFATAPAVENSTAESIAARIQKNRGGYLTVLELGASGMRRPWKPRHPRRSAPLGAVQVTKDPPRPRRPLAIIHVAKARRFSRIGRLRT